jgi:hypothetical protein
VYHGNFFDMPVWRVHCTLDAGVSTMFQFTDLELDSEGDCSDFGVDFDTGFRLKYAASIPFTFTSNTPLPSLLFSPQIRCFHSCYFFLKYSAPSLLLSPQIRRFHSCYFHLKYAASNPVTFTSNTLLPSLLLSPQIRCFHSCYVSVRLF